MPRVQPSSIKHQASSIEHRVSSIDPSPINSDWIQEVTLVVKWAARIEPLQPGRGIGGKVGVRGQLRFELGLQLRVARQHLLRPRCQSVALDVFGALQNLEKETPGKQGIVARWVEQRHRKL